MCVVRGLPYLACDVETPRRKSQTPSRLPNLRTLYQIKKQCPLFDFSKDNSKQRQPTTVKKKIFCDYHQYVKFGAQSYYRKKYLSFSKNLVNYERKNSVCICINGDLI